jgi:hypothetical protein
MNDRLLSAIKGAASIDLHVEEEEGGEEKEVKLTPKKTPKKVSNFVVAWTAKFQLARVSEQREEKKMILHNFSLSQKRKREKTVWDSCNQSDNWFHPVEKNWMIYQKVFSSFNPFIQHSFSFSSFISSISKFFAPLAFLLSNSLSLSLPCALEKSGSIKHNADEL